MTTRRSFSTRISAPHRVEFHVLTGFIIALLGAIGIAVLPLEYTLAGLAFSIGLVLVLITPAAAIVFLLILSPLRALILTEAPERIPFDIGLLLTVLVTASWFMHRIIKRRPLFVSIRSSLLAPLLLFVGVNLITGFVAFSISAWLLETLKWVVVGLLAYIVATTMQTARREEWLIFALCGAGAANALVGLHIFLGGSGALHLLVNDRFFRAFGTFGQPNPFGGFMGLLAPLAIMMAYGYAHLAWRRWRWYGRIEAAAIMWLGFYLFCTLSLVVGVFISWSRGAWLGLSLSLVVMLSVIPHRWSQRTGVLFLVAVTGFMLWNSSLLPATITSRVESVTSELFTLYDVRAVDITFANYPIVERLAHWQAALNMAKHNIWLGVGAGNYEPAYPIYRLINWDEPLGHAHNFYLNVLAETGIIGLFAFLYLLMSLVWVSWHAQRHPDVVARAMAIGLLGTWTYLLAHSVTDNLFVNNLFLHIGVMVGIVIGLEQSVKPMRAFST